MKTILDFDSALMSARTDFERWRVKFEEEFGEPIGRMQLFMLLASMPPGVHQAMSQRKPEAYRAVIEKLGGE